MRRVVAILADTRTFIQGGKMREQKKDLADFCGGYWKEQTSLLGCIGKAVGIHYYEPSVGEFSAIVGKLKEIRITVSGLTLFVEGGYSKGYLIPRKREFPKDAAIIASLRAQGELIYEWPLVL